MSELYGIWVVSQECHCPPNWQVPFISGKGFFFPSFTLLSQCHLYPIFRGGWASSRLCPGTWKMVANRGLSRCPVGAKHVKYRLAHLILPPSEVAAFFHFIDGETEAQFVTCPSVKARIWTPEAHCQSLKPHGHTVQTRRPCCEGPGLAAPSTCLFTHPSWPWPSLHSLLP